MTGRLWYYLEKAKLKWRQNGFLGLVREFLSFLIRRRLLLGFFFEAIEYHVIAKGRSIDQTLIKVLKDEPLKGPKVLLYVSFDSASVIQPHVVQQLQFFASQGYQNIWVSASAQVSETEFKKIAEWVHLAIHRKNDGYDFASWRLAFSYLRGVKMSSLVMMNDSCLGPEFDFKPLLLKMESTKDAAFGITKSYEIAEYLQSYFIHFGRALLESGLVEHYFSRIRILRSKWAIVRYLEIGGSQFLIHSGTRLEALIDPKEPTVAAIMAQHDLTDPVRDPAGREWVKLGLNPFWKRSNQVKSIKSD